MEGNIAVDSREATGKSNSQPNSSDVKVRLKSSYQKGFSNSIKPSK